MANDIQKPEPTMSERFTKAVLTEFSSNAGELTFGPHQKKLAQHLFIKADQQLNEQEARRIAKNQTNKAPIIWQNINMQKLALDAVRRIELGLDALAPNHVHVIPYFNSKLKKYDLDLRIGYEGKMFYRREIAIEPPADVRIELVYSTDHFKPIKKSVSNKAESYEFEITNPFERGDIIGGFGYIIYEDETKNKLILVTKKDFEKSEKQGNDDFWKKNPTEMKYKTIVHRVADKLSIDPKKMSVAVADAEAQDDADFQHEIEEKANKEVIDIETGEIIEEPAKEQEKKPEPKQESKPEPELVGTGGGNGHQGPDF